MRKKILVLALVLVLVATCLLATACGSQDKTIYVCASELPHADILQNCVAQILKEKGYTLKVSVLDWTLQNDAVAQADYDANYFQHVPYLQTYAGTVELFAVVKVHYEPLGIYCDAPVEGDTGHATVAICNDESNAVRALELLYAKGFIANLPVADGKLTFTGTTWTSDNNVTVTLIAEELLVASMPDYQYVCLPCNTAMTGNVDQSKKIAQEDDATLVAGKANVLAARSADYQNDAVYKAKIDALAEALLSAEVASYVATKYGGAITCDASSQIDLRN